MIRFADVSFIKEQNNLKIIFYTDCQTFEQCQGRNEE